jgi:hypothetical protein
MFLITPLSTFSSPCSGFRVVIIDSVNIRRLPHQKYSQFINNQFSERYHFCTRGENSGFWSRTSRLSWLMFWGVLPLSPAKSCDYILKKKRLGPYYSFAVVLPLVAVLQAIIWPILVWMNLDCGAISAVL